MTMHLPRRALGTGLMGAGLITAFARTTRAQGAYPTRAVQVVVPYAPSGGTDLTAREVAQALTTELGQQVVILNRPGAATIVGTQLVAEAPPDGYTLLMDSFPLVANPSLYRKLPYDSAKALAPIARISNAPTVLVATPDQPFKTAAELVAYCKKNPNSLNYASFGIGSGAHLAAELFQAVTGVKLVHIPYDGGGPAATAVISGEVQLLFSSLLPVLGSIKGGLMRAIAVASSSRSALLPDVPTFAEGGIGYDTGTWFGLLAPAATPAPIISRVSAALVKAVGGPPLRDQIIAQGAEPIGDSPAEFGAFIQSETARWRDVIARAHIEVQ